MLTTTSIACTGALMRVTVPVARSGETTRRNPRAGSADLPAMATPVPERPPSCCRECSRSCAITARNAAVFCRIKFRRSRKMSNHLEDRRNVAIHTSVDNYMLLFLVRRRFVCRNVRLLSNICPSGFHWVCQWACYIQLA